MAAESSFDVVSQFDRQELVNAIDQTMRELNTRYDLKGTGSQVRLEKDAIELASASEFTLGAVRELLIQRAARRNLSPKIFDFQKVEQAARGTVRQTAKLRQGIDQDLARQPKAQAAATTALPLTCSRRRDRPRRRLAGRGDSVMPFSEVGRLVGR